MHCVSCVGMRVIWFCHRPTRKSSSFWHDVWATGGSKVRHPAWPADIAHHMRQAAHIYHTRFVILSRVPSQQRLTPYRSIYHMRSAACVRLLQIQIRSVLTLLGRGPCAHLTWTFSGSILVLPGLSASSRWPSAGCLEVKKLQYCVVISSGISSDIGYCDVFVAQ